MYQQSRSRGRSSGDGEMKDKPLSDRLRASSASFSFSCLLSTHSQRLTWQNFKRFYPLQPNATFLSVLGSNPYLF